MFLYLLYVTWVDIIIKKSRITSRKYRQNTKINIKMASKGGGRKRDLAWNDVSDVEGENTQVECNYC